MKIENGDNTLLKLYKNFELNLSVHARTASQNARAQPIH